MMRKNTAAIGFATILAITSAGGVESALAQVNVETAPQEMSLQIANDAPGEQCRRLDQLDPTSLIRVTLHRTFHDDFDTHPLSSGLWVPHYAGGAAWPEAQYWGGDGSDAKRKDAWNGEQQIYVDPKYQGRGTVALGLDPFKVRNGVLSIMASRIPTPLKSVLFNNEYVSGILTTQSSFAQ